MESVLFKWKNVNSGELIYFDRNIKESADTLLVADINKVNIFAHCCLKST